jgi:UDP-N-acetylglucosamine 4,6-dehydratase/5-epimerase
MPGGTVTTILVTGGTGFLGRALALNLRNKHRIVLTGRNNKQNANAAHVTGCEVLSMDVTNIEGVRDTFVEVKPDIVIHAAATKFVDLAERQPMECVDVNVIGSQNVIRVALERSVDGVIGISTDKATPPVRNTYGLTKALMERMLCTMNGKTDTRCMAVRYGNVAWSTGSVLPVWHDMHKRTGIIGTTGPEMTRFFFTVDEAVALVLTAMDHLNDFQGKVLSRTMKSALIRDVLDIWVAEKGGIWKRIEGRPGERGQEFLVGELELPYTRALEIDGVEHYLISFNEKCETPLERIVSSNTAGRLSAAELKSLILNPRSHEIV